MADDAKTTGMSTTGGAGTAGDAATEQILDRVEQKAIALMRKYHVCGAVVIMALQEELNLPGGDIALKALSFTGLGIARTGYACGAFLGGINALGLASGTANFAKEPIYPEPENIDDVWQLPKSLLTVREFCTDFKEKIGGLECAELQVKYLGKYYDTMIPEEENKFYQSGMMQKCNEIVGKAARLAAEKILKMPRR